MAFVNTEAPKFPKRRKLGKNKKKSWRAANVKDIEDFLTDERRQKESGGLVSEKADDTLFVVDTGRAGETVLGAAPKGKRSRKKLLKCHALLLPDPQSRRAVRKSEASHFKQGKRTIRILDRVRAKTDTKKGITAESQRKESIVERGKKREEKRKLPEVTSDLWADTEGVKKRKVEPPKKYRKKPSALPATAVAHPGASVNPSYDDHQNLLQEALTVEQKKLKEEQRIHNALNKMFPTRETAPDEKTYIAEMSAGLVDNSDDDDDENQDGDENISLSVNPPVRRESKKTRKQRRIENKLTTEVKDKEKKTNLRRRENMVLRIRSLKSEIHKEETKQKEKAALKRKLKEEEPYKTKRLGSVKYQEPDLDLKLSTELVGSFREVKPEGHLLNDMYSSLCKRNIVEPRVKQRRKRTYKKKTFQRK